MRIRLLSERGGHQVGDEIQVAADDPIAAAWLANHDAEVVSPLPPTDRLVDEHFWGDTFGRDAAEEVSK